MGIMKLDKKGLSGNVWGAPKEAGAKGGVVFLIIGLIAFVIIFGIFSIGIPIGCNAEAGECSIAPNPFLKRYVGNLLLGSRAEGETNDASLGEIDIMTLISNPSAYAQQASAMWREPEETHVLQTDKPYAAIEFPSRTITLSETSLSEDRAKEYGVYAKFQIKNSGDAEITNMTVLFSFTTTEVNDPTQDPPVEFYCNSIDVNAENGECPSGYTLYGNKCGTDKITVSLLRSGETEEVRCESIKIFGSSGDTYGIRVKVYVNYHQTAFLPIMFINSSYSEEMQFTGQESELKSQAKYMCSACPNACCWINSYGVGEFFGEVKIPIISDYRTESINPMIKNAGDGSITQLNNVVISVPNDLINENFNCGEHGKVYTDLKTFSGICTAQGCVCQDPLYQQVMSDLCTEVGTCECIERINGNLTNLVKHICPQGLFPMGDKCSNEEPLSCNFEQGPTGFTLSGTNCNYQGSSCPVGYTYNNGQCIITAVPVCTTGTPVDGVCTYEANTACSAPYIEDVGEGTCTATAAPQTCPTGYPFNEDTDLCEADPVCETGTYDDVDNQCEDAGVRTEDAICPVGGGILNIDTDICELDPACQTGYTPSGADCISTSSACDAGYVYDSDEDQCVSDVAPICNTAAGYELSEDLSECVLEKAAHTRTYTIQSNGITGKCVYEKIENAETKTDVICNYGDYTGFKYGIIESQGSICREEYTFDGEHTCFTCWKCPDGYDYNIDSNRCNRKRSVDIPNTGICPVNYKILDNRCYIDPFVVITDNIFANRNTAQSIHELDPNYQFCSYENITEPLKYTAMALTITKPINQMNSSRLNTYMVRGDMSYVYVKSPTQGVINIV